MGREESAEASRETLRANATRCLASWREESAAASGAGALVGFAASAFGARVSSSLFVRPDPARAGAGAPEPPRWDESEGMAAAAAAEEGGSRRGRETRARAPDVTPGARACDGKRRCGVRTDEGSRTGAASGRTENIIFGTRRGARRRVSLSIKKPREVP